MLRSCTSMCAFGGSEGERRGCVDLSITKIKNVQKQHAQVPIPTFPVSNIGDALWRP